MKKSLASAVGGVAVVAAVFGAGVAGANNEYVGQTYEQASESMNARSVTPVIASRVGSYLPTGKCKITGSRTSKFLDSSGRNNASRSVLLDLNCNAPTAQEGHPGNSLATTEGQKGKELRDTGTRLSNDFAKASAAGKPSWCGENADRCKSLCEKTDTCSAELRQFLGL